MHGYVLSFDQFNSRTCFICRSYIYQSGISIVFFLHVLVSCYTYLLLFCSFSRSSTLLLILSLIMMRLDPASVATTPSSEPWHRGRQTERETEVIGGREETI